MLNAIWAGMILTAFAVALVNVISTGQGEILVLLVKSIFDSAKTGFEISLGLAGVMTLWLGLMRVAEAGGFLALITRGLAPLFKRLMPEVPPAHPAQGAVVMNLSATARKCKRCCRTPRGVSPAPSSCPTSGRQW